MYALVEIKGKQYKAQKGDLLKVDKLQNESGDNMEFDSVLMLNSNDKIMVGTPYLKDVKVKATLKEHKKDKKINVFKFKKRKNYSRRKGHRQQYSFIRIDDIVSK